MRTVRRFLVLLLLALPVPVRAQGTTDVLAGRVTDPDGKPMVGAVVQATSAELGTTRSGVTDEKGRYMIMFPDGGGQYQVKISFLGMADRTFVLRRQADEEVLLANVAMSVQPITLAGIDVQGRRPAPGQGNSGERAENLTAQLLNRLPLPDFDPATLAALAAGVILTGADSITGLAGFSIAGMNDALNQITLDGMAIGSLLSGAGGLDVPMEGLRMTQVVTSTFDASRGGFAGGQVSMTTARGTNRSTGSFTYQLRDAALQGNAGSTALGNVTTQHRLSGGFGGPIVPGKLFFNVAGSAQFRTNDMFAMATNDALSSQRVGASADSVNRFLDILGGTYGFPTDGLTGPYAARNNNFALQTRMDFNVTPRNTLMLRFNANKAGQDSTRISPLDVRDNGGEQDSDRTDGALQLQSRFGFWTNDLQFTASKSTNQTLPFVEMPEGRVRVTSELSDGALSVSQLVFGGDRSLPTETYEKNFQLRDEVGLLYDLTHRIKLGAQVAKSDFSSINASNYLGSFTFLSLADFQANLPASFSRSLTPRERTGASTTASAWLTDTWRASDPLQITAGLRLDNSRFDDRPGYNPVVEEVFGQRTDVFPTDLHVSPRFGFSYRLSENGMPAKVLRGGIGEFRGTAPYNLFASALQQTGLPGSEVSINCIGQAVPTPDWLGYLNEPSSIPSTCLDGGTGSTLQTERAPTVTLFSKDFGAPSSWRANLGYQTQLRRGFTLNVDYTYSLGSGLYGARDLNLDTTRIVYLTSEGNRPFYGDPASIASGSGQVVSTASRIDSRFSGVYEYDSDLRSTSHQLSLRTNGMLTQKLMVQASYSLGFTRDQSSFSGRGGGAGGVGFESATTSANPNEFEWATSSNDRRHAFSLVLAYPITTWAQVTAVGRITSGSPFTPMVGSDINGDGARNDRAFVFDPATVSDPLVAQGMMNVLAAAPAGIRDCLESQFGQVAARNSCRNEWTQSLDMRFMLSPNLPRLGHRVEISADLSNVPAAMDQLLHGDNLHGWGQPNRADGTLLYARGFDKTTNSFVYEVNQLFGQSRTQRFGSGAPFQIVLQARVGVGQQRPGAMGAMGGFGGGGGGGRGGGGFGGGFGGRGGGDFGGGGGGGGAGGRRGGMAGDSTGFNVGNILDRLLANPVEVIYGLRDTLQMTEVQAIAVKAISDSLNVMLAAVKAEVRKDFEGADVQQMAGRLQEITTKTEPGRKAINDALKATEKALTPAQWKKIPERIRSPFQAGMGRGGRGGG